MGACCTKDASFAAIIAREMEEYEQEEENEQVTKGDYEASIRLKGSSAFVSMSTQQGNKGVNQDAMTVWEDFSGEKDVLFCGVFDGHGSSGHRVSHSVCDNLPCKIGALYNSSLGAGSDDDDDHVLRCWKRCLVRSFKDMDKALGGDVSIDTYCSGATGVTVIKQGHHLIVGNLGDSRAIVGTRGDKGRLVPVQLTVDLKPSVASEAERIRHCSGRVFALEEEPKVVRVWQPQEDCPGLAMTRAFGDFCLKDYGVISTPQVFHRNLTHRDEFVILATDGIWDVLTNLEVVEIISSAAAKNRSMAARLLVRYASRAWRRRYPSSRTDDIAVVCLFLKRPETA